MQPAPPAQLRQIGLAPADGATAICPGAPFQVVVTGTATDGRTLATPTSYRGGAVWYEEHGLPWQRFQITSSVGSITPAAMFAPPPSIFTLAETSAVQLHAVDLANPQLVADLSMPVDFHCGQTLALRGQPGAAGANGSSGQQGGMGGQVQISVGRMNTHAHGAVIFARVDSALGRTYYLLQPGGGALVVDLSGGAGGGGGEGLHAQVEYRDTDSQGNVDRSQDHVPGSAGPGRRRWSGRQRGDPRRRERPAARAGRQGLQPGRCRRDRRCQRSWPRRGAGGRRSHGPGRSAAADSYEDPSLIFADEIAQGFPVAQPEVARRREPRHRH